MKKIVSFFGENTEIFKELNKRAEDYAKSLNMEYKWSIQMPYSKESVIQELQDADAGIIDIQPYGEDIFSQIYKKTKLLVRFGVGYDKVDLEAAGKYGIAVARTTAANNTAVAEMALTLMLTAKRKILQGQKCVRDGVWEKNVANEIIDGTVGIVGFGGIGQRLAELLKGFNCKILVYDPMPNMEAIKKLGVELTDLDTVLKKSDAVSIHVPLLESTYKMIGKKEFEIMKPTSVIVNTSRGGIVDEEALYDALSNNEIAGAALDVFEKEPLETSSKLLKLDNIVMTPHVSSQTYESLWKIYKMAIDIVNDYYEKNDFKNILNMKYMK